MWLLRRRYGPYVWTRTSREFYHVLDRTLHQGERILEFGSSTGHISFRLAREGHNVSLLDIRAEPINAARQMFAKAGVPARFIVENFLNHHESYDLLWNSGLIQCLAPAEQDALLEHAAAISPRLLLFYPDTDDSSGKVRGKDAAQLPGVGNATEYPINDLPERFSKHFAKVYWGRLAGRTMDLSFDMYWLQGDNPCASV